MISQQRLLDVGAGGGRRVRRGEISRKRGPRCGRATRAWWLGQGEWHSSAGRSVSGPGRDNTAVVS